MNPWGEDPTDQMPVPRPPVEHHTHHHAERRGESVAVIVIVFLTFALGAGITLAATYSLANTVDRLLSVPICREVK